MGSHELEIEIHVYRMSMFPIEYFHRKNKFTSL